MVFELSTLLALSSKELGLGSEHFVCSKKCLEWLVALDFIIVDEVRFGDLGGEEGMACGVEEVRERKNE